MKHPTLNEVPILPYHNLKLLDNQNCLDNMHLMVNKTKVLKYNF